MSPKQINISELLPQKQPLEFFQEIYHCYQQAVQKSSTAVKYYYNVAGFIVCLSFASDALVPGISPALAHLKTDSIATLDFTICIWDSHSTNTKIPPPPWQGNHLQKRGEIMGLNSDRIHTSFQWGANALSMVDKEKNLGIYWVNKADLLPYWEKGSPLRAILQVWLAKQGIQMVHAGAVGLPEGGVLLTGKGGSGKSTTALSCLDSELFYVSDDYSLITSNPIPTVYSIYSTAKKRANDIDRLPFLKPIISNSDRLSQEKALYFLNEHFPQKIIRNFPLKAVLIPRITGKEDTSLEKTASIMGLSTLVPSTIKQLPSTGKEACQIINDVVKKLPCYYLNLGTDLKQTSQVIVQLLTENKTTINIDG